MKTKIIFSVLALLVVVIVLIVWLGNKNQPTASVSDSVITSEDGLVTLTIPATAFPEGVTADDIVITNVSEPMTGYQFEPDGLTFVQPVTMTMTISGIPDTIPQLVWDSATTLEVIPEQAVDMDYEAQVTTVTAQVDHFSRVYDGDFFALDLPDEGEYYLNEVWPFTVTWNKVASAVDVVRMTSDGIKPFTFIQVDPWSVSGKIKLGPTSRLLTEPTKVDPFPKFTDLTGQNSFSTYENFRCIQGGRGFLDYTFTLSWLYNIEDFGGDTFGSTTTVTLGWPFTCLDSETGTTGTNPADDFIPTNSNINASDDTTESNYKMSIEVLALSGGLYPSEQFHKADPDACGAEHWHASGTVYTIDLGGATTDPNPTGCGFGKTNEVSAYNIEVTVEEWEKFRAGPQ